MPAPSHVFILRHGHRLDMSDPSWIHTTPTPWDPPLTPLGLSQSSQTGSQLPTLLPAPPPRVVIHTSPFLRCVQTALALAASLPVRPILRIDAWLGEWLTDDYFADITPPPAMAVVVADAQRALMRALDNVVVDFAWQPGEMAELGEEWSSMHGRFKRGWRRLLAHYEAEGGEAAAVVLVTHGAGCNALLGAVSERPVLMDVGIGALSLAVRREAGDGYEVQLEAARPAVKKSARSASETSAVRPSLGLWSPNEEEGGVKGLWKAKGWARDGEPVKRRWTLGREGIVGLEGVGSVGGG